MGKKKIVRECLPIAVRTGEVAHDDTDLDGLMIAGAGGVVGANSKPPSYHAMRPRLLVTFLAFKQPPRCHVAYRPTKNASRRRMSAKNREDTKEER